MQGPAAGTATSEAYPDREEAVPSVIARRAVAPVDPVDRVTIRSPPALARTAGRTEGAWPPRGRRRRDGRREDPRGMAEGRHRLRPLRAARHARHLAFEDDPDRPRGRLRR